MKGFLRVAVIAFICVSAGTCLAQEKAKRTSVYKEIEGELSWLGKERLSVIYFVSPTGESDTEMLLPYGRDIQVVHKRSLEEIHTGDRVRVGYEEVTEQSPDGNKVTKKATSITFVSSAVKPKRAPGEGDAAFQAAAAASGSSVFKSY